jgi:hypothetical protein
MAVRDLFAAVARPAAPPPPPAQTPTSFQARWAELGEAVAAKWGQPKRYWLEMKTAWIDKLIQASAKASNAAWSAALDDLRGANDCPHNISTWMAAAIERAIDAESHKPAEHLSHDGESIDRRRRAYQRIARGTGHDGAP